MLSDVRCCPERCKILKDPERKLSYRMFGVGCLTTSVRSNLRNLLPCLGWEAKRSVRSVHHLPRTTDRMPLFFGAGAVGMAVVLRPPGRLETRRTPFKSPGSRRSSCRRTTRSWKRRSNGPPPRTEPDLAKTGDESDRDV